MSNKFILSVIGIFLFLNIFAWTAVWDLSQLKFLEVIFFDIQQGDGALIKSSEGHYILIDGGPDSKILEKLSKEIPFWQKEIDLIILSHPHNDHFGGLTNVIQRYRVKNILSTGIIEKSPSFKKWQNSALGSEAELKIAFAGQRIRGENFFIDILYPFFSLEGIEFKDANLSSIVLRLVFKETSFLFTGDAYKSIEKELILKEIFCLENNDYLCQERMILDSNVLKVGHHGSKTSTGEDFVQAVSPEIAIISAGRDNRYGHPHKETLDILKKYDINIFRTDLVGDIKIFSNGEKIKF